jgi:sugar lactone lactonase YvrE
LAKCAHDERLLLAGERQIWTLDRRGQGLSLVYTLPSDQPLHRFNDGAVDVAGRFWVGSMPNNLVEPIRSAPHLEATGRMFVIASDGSSRSFEAQFGCPNAICWSPEGTVMYVADSVSQWIYAHDFNAASGELGRRRLFCRLDGLGIPDGAAVDSEGYIWNARWGAGVVARIDPAGRLAQTVELPVTNPTACCFGGPGGQDLYVTSARYGLSDEQLARETIAGGVFAIATTTRGLSTNLFGNAPVADGA